MQEAIMNKTLILCSALSVITLGLSAADSSYQKTYSSESTPNNQHSQSNSYHGEGNHNNRSVNGANGTLNDEDIKLQKKIKDALAGSWFSKSYENVQAELSGGLVTLKGSVESQKDSLELEKKIRGIEGVTDVRNMLEIKDKQHRAKEANRNQVSWFSRSSNPHIAMNDNQTNSLSDSEIKSRIKDELQNTWFTPSYDSITVDVDNGNVTITGIVSDSGDSEEIENRVSKIRGVKIIRNNLSFSSDQNNQAAKVSDKDIKQRIDDELKNSWWGNYPKVKVNVNRGVVILSGTVESSDDLSNIQDRLSGIPGVKVIRSELVIDKHR